MQSPPYASPRVAPRFYLPLLVRMGAFPGKRSRNVSLSGLFIETENKPPLGAIVPLFLIWGSLEAESNIRIVRHAADGVGASYLQPDDHFLSVLAQIIEETEQTLPQLTMLQQPKLQLDIKSQALHKP